jgi:hydrogenase/urease accessory protein HupE
MKRLASAIVVLPSVALAHPGDHHATGLLHLLTEPDHLAMIAAVVAVLGYAVYRWARR